MRLTRLAIQNFRSLYKIDLLLKPLTIIIGPNASGKSNLFKALRFLQDAVTGDIKDWQAYSGQVDHLRWYGLGVNGERPTELSFDLRFGNAMKKSYKARYGLTLSAEKYLEVAQENLDL